MYKRQVLDSNDIARVGNLPTSMTTLSMRDNALSTLSGMERLRTLTYLDLSQNRITSLSGLENLKRLKTLYLDENDLSDLTGMPEVSNCTIGLTYNSIDMNSTAQKAILSDLRSDGNTVTAVPQMVKGWQQEGNYYYYFLDDKGTFATGTQEIDGKTYTFDSQGRYSENGTTDPEPENPTENLNGKWVLQNGVYYFQKTDGNYATGWQKISGEWYYLNPSDGAMKTGWLNLNGTYYYLHSSGKMLTGWQKYDTAWYYMKPGSGEMQTGWLQLGNTWYYLKDWGGMATGWCKVGGTWYLSLIHIWLSKRVFPKLTLKR